MNFKNLLFTHTFFLFCFNICLAEPLIVAHRGSSHVAPENTLPAFHLAWEEGADAVEGDFLLTKDGKIVCIHDGSTKRLSDKNLVVSKTTLRELQTLDVGSWKHEKYKGTKIPTIAEVFATIPKGKKIFIEVKCGPEIVIPLVKEIKRSGLETNQVRLICFKTEVIKAFKDKMPKHKAYWLSNFKKDGKGLWKPSIDTVLKVLKDINADGLDSHRSIPDTISKAILGAGFEWHAWTINDLRTAKKLGGRGIHSLTTDRPKLLSQGF